MEGAGLGVSATQAHRLEEPGRPGLHVELWRNPCPRATLVLVPGLGDHCGRYGHVSSRLSGEHGLVDVVGFDPRGHGRSEGRRGVVRRYEELIDDLMRVIGWAERRTPGRPLFVLGHSNGGLVTMSALIDHQPKVAGVILSAPALALKARIPPWKLAAGRLLGVVAPWVTLGGRLPGSHLTRDPRMLAARRADPLVHSRLSPPLFFGMLDAAARIGVCASQVRTPLLLIVGRMDPVIDSERALGLAERVASRDVSVEVLPRGVHEPLHDLEWRLVVERVADWLRERVGPTD